MSRGAYWVAFLVKYGFVIATLLLLTTPPITAYFFWHSAALSWRTKSPITLDQFIAMSGWAQAFVAWLTLLVVSFAAIQVMYIYRQQRIEQERAESEIYHRLIAPDMQSTKRFINTPEVQEVFARLREVVSAICALKDSRDVEEGVAFDVALAELRSSLDSVAGTMSWPLLPDTKMGLDYVELLINEYNYVSMLIVTGRVERGFASTLLRNNFRRTYALVEPVIALRRIRTPKFAGSFSMYCQE